MTLNCICVSPAQDPQLAIADMNDDLRGFANWCFENMLLLNLNKNELIVYGSRQVVSKLPKFLLSLLGKDLFPADFAKDLGVTFDCNFNFNKHTLKTVSSDMSCLGQISRVKHVFRKELLVTVINAFVFSKLYYCLTVWSNTSDWNIQKLQGIHRTLRLVLSVEPENTIK